MAPEKAARYCPCGTRLARDNAGDRCGACTRKERQSPGQPLVLPAEFWRHAQMREALESWHFGQVLYAYRTHPHHGRALSQGAVADWLGVTQAQLSRIENGSAPQDLSKLMQWAHSLKIPADLLWFKLPDNERQFAAAANPWQETDHHRSEQPPQTQGSSLLPVMVNGHRVFVPVDAEALATNGFGSLSALPADSTTATECEAMSPLHRRTLLSGIAAAALPGLGLEELQRVASALEDSRRYLDGPVVDHFRTQLDRAKRDDGALGPKKSLPVVLGLLGAIEQHARGVKPKVRRELLSVGADGAEFAGWLYRDIHQPGQAGFWYDRAMEWAQEADDTAMQGYVLLKKSQMAYDKRDGLRVLTLAQAGAHERWQLPPRVRAEVTQQEALGLAMTGESMDVVKHRSLFSAVGAI